MALRDWISSKPATVATTATDRAGLPVVVADVADVATAQEIGKARCATLDDPEVHRRRVKALALLDADPQREVAIVAECGDPAHVVIAIRGAAVGELTIPADRYDAFALLALMEQHGHA